MHFTKSKHFYLMEVATNSKALSLTKINFYLSWTQKKCPLCLETNCVVLGW